MTFHKVSQLTEIATMKVLAFPSLILPPAAAAEYPNCQLMYP